MEKYNVYEISPCSFYYRGMSLVAAETVEEANEFIDCFISVDSDNGCNSFGYSHVDELDIIDHLYSDEKGIILYGISYNG